MESFKISRNTLETVPTYIDLKCKSGEVIQDNNPLPTSTNALSHNQQLAFDIVLQHSQVQGPKEPLQLIIQGTIGIGKSYLIGTIKNAMSCQAIVDHSPLLLLTPTGIATFNIHATTIHAGLHIPIKDMKPLHGKSLSVFQEEMKHIQYILIDEMSFIGPKLFMQIEIPLCDCFPETNNHSFKNRSIIRVGDLGQLPPVMGRPIYARETLGKCLWKDFTSVIILEIILWKMGTDVTQLCFC